MRFRVTRILIPCLAGLLLTPPLFSQEAITRLSPAPRVGFRGGAQSREVSLRESPPVAPAALPSATTTIVRPGVARLIPPSTASAPARTALLPPPAVASKSGVETVVPTLPRKTAPPAVAKAAPPAKSVLSPRNDPPAAALPPGGRDLSLQPTTFTPYDRYLGSVRSVISNLESQDANMLLATKLMKTGRRFKYCVCDPYRADPPALTEARKAGDCKSKALWLYSNLGDGNALFVIGKAEKRAKNSHAWVYWRYDNRWWILDCTERSDPIAADSVSSDRYVPYYSFGRGGAYRHNATRLILTGSLPAEPKPVAALK